MKSKRVKVRVPTPQQVEQHVRELQSLDAQMLFVYLEARNGGASHEDGMDAVKVFCVDELGYVRL